MIFDLGAEVKRATAARLSLEWIAIPKSILKPVSGPCVECGYESEDQHCGEWLHDDCNDALVDEQREDERLDSPVHDQFVNGIFRG